MRTNHSGVTEKAEFNINREAYAESWERIFGKKKETDFEADKRLEQSSDRVEEDEANE